jgi:hypothetical protein
MISRSRPESICTSSVSPEAVIEGRPEILHQKGRKTKHAFSCLDAHPLFFGRFNSDFSIHFADDLKEFLGGNTNLSSSSTSSAIGSFKGGFKIRCRDIRSRFLGRQEKMVENRHGILLFDNVLNVGELSVQLFSLYRNLHAFLLNMTGFKTDSVYSDYAINASGAL